MAIGTASLPDCVKTCTAETAFYIMEGYIIVILYTNSAAKLHPEYFILLPEFVFLNRGCTGI